MEYFSRVADQMLRDRLEAFGAILIEGPKWTGKTTTAEQLSKIKNNYHILISASIVSNNTFS